MAALSSIWHFLTTSPYGIMILIILILLLVLVVVVPLIMKLKRKRLKKKETKDIMKDLFTWRHLAQLVKGGEEHKKAKQELSDNIVKINELLKQGFAHITRNEQNLYNMPWYILLGEPMSGKSSLLEASELELVPSMLEENTANDPRQSLPVRFWTGAKSVIIDISGKVFFDRWLEESGGEWLYIIKQICRKRQKRALDGVILTIPADALLADDANLSSRKAILMAKELGALLRQSGMKLPCYVAITKLDMVCGFQEYVKILSGDQRHQILGFENDNNVFQKESFAVFWDTLIERLRSGAKQLLFPLPVFSAGDDNSRMNVAGKIWLFPENLDVLYKNLTVYLDILFGENNFHGTKNTYFEGMYLTSSREIGFSFSPDIAALAGRDTENVLVPIVNRQISPVKKEPEAEISTALMVVNAARSLLNPYLQKAVLLRGYFIRDVLHQRVFVPSPHAQLVRSKVIRKNTPYYIICALLLLLSSFWLFGPIFRAGELQASLGQTESYYNWLGSVISRGQMSPLITEDPDKGFFLNSGPVDDGSLPSRLQFFYNTFIYRDMPMTVPFSFGLSKAFITGFDRNISYRDKAFITNQLHKSMVRIPVIKSVGSKFADRVDTQTLDKEMRNVIVSFVSLHSIKGIDFFRFFNSDVFKLDSMIRYLIPEISNDSMELLTNYLPHYDNSSAPQMDIHYVFSDQYRLERQAALDTMLSAWQRQDVYPDSVYGKLKTLTSISEELSANYNNIISALNRIHDVPTLGVENAVFEWRELSDRHRNLAAKGRAVFDDVEQLLNAANIHLAYEYSLPTINISAGSLPSISQKQLDAFGDNLINNYLYDDLVINYAVKEYTQLFERDMEFILQESPASRGAIIAEKNVFSSKLDRELEQLRQRVGVLQNDEYFSAKISDDPADPSLFIVAEQVVSLTAGIPLPRRETLQNTSFRAGWEQGQANIRSAYDSFESYVKQFAENEKLTAFITNARVMLLAEAFYNRYVIFTTSLAFLNTFEGNIAAVIESESTGQGLFAFSDSSIEGLFGGFYYQHSYDPVLVKLISDDAASFIALIKTGQEGENQPMFLRNIDSKIYQPQAFMDYLSSYFRYWENYPENMYVSAGNWNGFMDRSNRYRSFQINSVLLSVYVRSLEAVNNIDNTVMNESVSNVKTRAAASLGNRLALLNQFLSTDAERMFSAWASLPADPLRAYQMLRNLPEDDLKSSYLTVYTPPAADTQALSLGWWNSFVLDGLGILARECGTRYKNELMEKMNRLRAWPIEKDASENMTMQTMEELAALLDAMGARIEKEDPDPAIAYLHRNQFRGTVARNWAKNVFQIVEAVTDPNKPLSWTLYQAPVEVQQWLSGRGRLLAMNRFRYIQVSSGYLPPRASSTYMLEKLAVIEGNARDENISLRFFLTSQDTTPRSSVILDRPWAIFLLYLRDDIVADNDGNTYIPIYFEDDAGRYVYYVTVEFNREIPDPSVWYSARYWPDFIATGEFISDRGRGYVNETEP